MRHHALSPPLWIWHLRYGGRSLPRHSKRSLGRFLQRPTNFTWEFPQNQLSAEGPVVALSPGSFVNNFCWFCASASFLMSSRMFARGLWNLASRGARRARGLALEGPAVLSCLFHRHPGLASKEIRRQWLVKASGSKVYPRPPGLLPAEHFKSSLGFPAKEGGIFWIRALSLLAPGCCLSCKSTAELSTSCHLFFSQPKHSPSFTSFKRKKNKHVTKRYER